MNKIVVVFLETDMRMQHAGLVAMSNRRVKVSDLNPGEHIVFTNRSMNRIKMMSYGGVLTYLNPGRRIDLAMVAQIPHSFNAKGEVDWVKAERLALEKKLKIVHKE